MFDGLRGVAIVLVVISHGWTLWPTGELYERDGLRQLFTSGDAAVSVFFVVGSFLATSGLLALRDSDRLRPPVAAVRRWVRLSAQTYVLLLVVLMVEVLEPGNTYPDRDTESSVLHVGTFTWNWFLHSNPTEARPDLGHLWYLSVDLQVFLIVLFAVWMLRRRLLLALALGAMLLLCVWWRAHQLDVDPFGVALRTWARADAPLIGALTAVVLPWLRQLTQLARWSGALAVGSAVALLPAFWFAADVRTYFGWGGLVVDLATATFIVGCTIGTPPAALHRVLGWAPLAFAGRHSLGVYLWHYPVFWFVARHTLDWDWPAKSLLAFAVTLGAAYLGYRYVEIPTQRLLDRPIRRRALGDRGGAGDEDRAAVSGDDAAGRSG